MIEPVETGETTLDKLEPGKLFRTSTGTYAVKSRYKRDGLWICILLGTGETTHFVHGNETRVVPLEIGSPQENSININVTDGTGRVWCTKCGLRKFIGISGADYTRENRETYVFNVLKGYIGNRRGEGVLKDASTLPVLPEYCAGCGVKLSLIVPVLAERFKDRSDY